MDGVDECATVGGVHATMVASGLVVDAEFTVFDRCSKTDSDSGAQGALGDWTDVWSYTVVCLQR